jgi:hypothetical protein
MVLASYGPGEKFNNAEKLSLKNNNPLPETEFENAVASQNWKTYKWGKPLNLLFRRWVTTGK